MVLLLLQLPDDLLQAILKKMARRDLCHLRMTGKRVDELVESMRHQIVSREEGTLRLFNAFFGAEDEDLNNEIFIGGPHDIRERRVKFGVFTYHSTEDIDVYSQKIRFESELAEVIDPVAQLSGFHIDAVTLNFGHLNLLKHFKNDELKKNEIELLFFCFDLLKLKCDRLYLGRVPLIFVHEFLKIIQFNYLFINVDETPGIEEFSTWPVFHCKERHFGAFKEVPSSISPYLRNLTSGSVIFRSEKDPLHLLSNYLFKAHLNRNARENMESLHFVAVFPRLRRDLKDLNLPGIVKIWRGIQQKAISSKYGLRPATLFKFPIDGGIAIILRDNEGLVDYDYTIYFVNDEPEEDIFNRIAEKLFRTIPFDFSDFFEKFLSQTDGQKAFDDLYTGYGVKDE